MKTVISAALALVVLGGLSGCTSHQFKNKVGQSQKQYIQDQAYCRSLATGQEEAQQEGQRLIPYDECMRQLGYTK